MGEINIYYEEKIPSLWQTIWDSFTRSPLALIGLWSMMLILSMSVLGPLIAPYSASYQDPNALLVPPSWADTGTVEHFLGTDDLGRDLFSRILHGAHLTFGYALIIVMLSLVCGFLIGSLSGMTKGLKASVLSHLLDTLLSMPSLVLAILFAAVLGPGLFNVIWAVGLSLVPRFVRTIHNAVHEERQKEYVVAARLDGATTWQVFYDSILPNVWNPVVVQTTLAFSVAILDIAALGFIGLGAQSPSPEWGAMIEQGLDNLLTAPWTVTMPGLAILFSVLATNVVGDGLRHALLEGRR
ncbi:cationic peptide transport system permease protein [Ferrimonas sediminum]|uniref:Cationic peptide transport system permease protein n=1 Tax=Ferrimonas sediminum TaxID=718193 RepID=A0A1G9ATY3_9GAMM|nr:ABC transporter permease subunit [Ferrimonas sediminum]SDK30717.1 cationic peptide transport system permease protein [Ferrimonas sediminum]